MIGTNVPLVFDYQAEIYNKHEIYFNGLSHLESIGLVRLNSTTGFIHHDLPKKCAVFYYGNPLTLEMPNDTGNILELGKVLLTKTGQELAPICGSNPVEGFRDYVMTQWEQYLPKSASG